MSQAATGVQKAPIEKPVKERKKRGAGVPKHIDHIAKDLKKASQGVERLRIEAQAGDVKREQDNARFVKIVRVAFGSKFEGLLKNHPALDADDLKFVGTYGFNV